MKDIDIQLQGYEAKLTKIIIDGQEIRGAITRLELVIDAETSYPQLVIYCIPQKIKVKGKAKVVMKEQK